MKPATDLSLSLPEWIRTAVDWNRKFMRDEEKMELAIELSSQNVANGTGGPFGAAIFDRESGRLLSVGVNQVVGANNAAAHAELLAIMLAGSSERSFTLAAGGRKRELFSSCEPCAMCIGATLWSGVSRLVCAASGDDARAIGFDEGPVFSESYRYLERAGIDVVREVLRKEARAVLQRYADGQGIIYNRTSS